VIPIFYTENDFGAMAFGVEKAPTSAMSGGRFFSENLLH
jgi:hypothetical protein